MIIKSKKYGDIDLSKLTKKERKIYDSIMSSFPATSPHSAYNSAIQGGVKYHFIPT